MPWVQRGSSLRVFCSPWLAARGLAGHELQPRWRQTKEGAKGGGTGRGSGDATPSMSLGLAVVCRTKLQPQILLTYHTAPTLHSNLNTEVSI